MEVLDHFRIKYYGRAGYECSSSGRDYVLPLKLPNIEFSLFAALKLHIITMKKHIRSNHITLAKH